MGVVHVLENYRKIAINLWCTAAVAFLMLFPLGLSDAEAETPVAPTLEDYMRDSEIRGITLSPDGSKLALIRRLDKRNYRLYVLDITSDYKPLSAMNEPSGMEMTRVSWLNDGRLGVTLKKKKREGRRYGYRSRRLMMMDVDGSNATPAFTDRKSLSYENYSLARITSTLPNFPDHILMNAWDGVPCVFRVNINDGTSEKVTCGGLRTYAFRVNSQGEPNLRIDYKWRSRKVTILSFNPEKKHWRKVSSFRYGEEDDVELEKHIASFDGDESFVLLDRKDEDEFYKLHRYNIKTNEFSEIAYEIDDYDVWDTIGSAHTDEILGVKYIADRPKYIFFDAEDQRVQLHLEKQFPNGVVRVSDISRDKKTYLFFTNEPWRRGSYFLYDNETKQTREIIDLAPHFKGLDTTSVDEITYRAKDKTMIESYLTYPVGRATEELPLIVYPHGGPFSRDWLSYDTFAQFWATRGYAVFQPNFRGSTGRGRTFEEAGYHELGGEMIEDIATGIRALIRSGRVDPDRICAAGASYGGYAALMLAIKTDLLTCAISINGPVDWEFRINTVLNDGRDKIARREFLEWADETIGNVKAQPELFREHSALKRASEISIPVMLIHARDDDNVDFRHSRKMHKAMKKAKKDVTFLPLKEGGHGLWWDDAEEKTLQATADFFAKYLKPELHANNTSNRQE